MISLQEIPQDGEEKTVEVWFALLAGFVLGVLVGFLVRSESRQFKADFGDDRESEH